MGRPLVSVLTLSGVALLLAGCPEKKPPPVVDAAPVEVPPPAPTIVNLVPEEPDAGEDAGVDAGVKKPTGPGVSTNVARLLQCCNQLSAEAKRMGSSPEAGLFVQAAAQCSATARQLGPGTNAPELGALKALLTGRTVPAVCAGF